MPFPLSITVFDPGLGGIPTTNNPVKLGPRIVDYTDQICNELGDESMRCSFEAHSLEEAIDWTERLMASVEVYTPSGRRRFSGFLNEVTIPALECSRSLIDMANVVTVRYTDPDGKKGTQVASNAASIARYGRKERLLNLSTAYAAEALNRAQTILAQIAEPSNKESVTIGEIQKPPYLVTLVFRGWAETLQWVRTVNATVTTAVTSTQVTGLLTAYNLVNAFFDTASNSVTATGLSTSQYVDPDTPYFERVSMLLAAGNSSQQRVAWGIYGRAITIAVGASAFPSTIAYYYSKRTRELRDASGNVIPPWDWTPDVMVQSIDLIEAAPATGAIASLTRKYIRRVTLRIGKDGVSSGTLEPDDVDKLTEMLAKPVSTTPGISERHAKIEDRLIRATRIRTINTDNPNIFDEDDGVLLPGGGGTGVIGPPGATGVYGTGTAPNLAKWDGPNSITNAISGTDYAPAHSHPYAATAHTHPAADVVSGILATGRLGSGTADVTKYLRGDSTWQDFTPAAIGGAPDDAKYIVQTAHAGLSAEQALSSLATGIMKVTTTTGAITSLGDPLPATNGGTGVNNSTRTITINTNPAIFTFSGAYTLTIPATGTTVLGTGTNGRMMFWTGTNTAGSNTNIQWDNSNLWLGIGGAPSYALHVFDTQPTVMSEATGSGQAQFTVKNTSGEYSMAISGSSWKLHDNDAGTDRITVSSAGQVGIAVAPSASIRLFVHGSGATSSTYSQYSENSSSSVTMWVRNDGAGFLAGSAWTYGSDERIKERVVDLDRGLAHILQLRPKRFDYINGQKDQIGFLAHEVKDVLPELVMPIDASDTGPDPLLGMQTTSLIPVLVAAVQELATRVETLEAT